MPGHWNGLWSGTCSPDLYKFHYLASMTMNDIYSRTILVIASCDKFRSADHAPKGGLHCCSLRVSVCVIQILGSHKCSSSLKIIKMACRGR